jgi:hypothetical protein
MGFIKFKTSCCFYYVISIITITYILGTSTYNMLSNFGIITLALLEHYTFIWDAFTFALFIWWISHNRTNTKLVRYSPFTYLFLVMVINGIGIGLTKEHFSKVYCDSAGLEFLNCRYYKNGTLLISYSHNQRTKFIITKNDYIKENVNSSINFVLFDEPDFKSVLRTDMGFLIAKNKEQIHKVFEELKLSEDSKTEKNIDQVEPLAKATPEGIEKNE